MTTTLCLKKSATLTSVRYKPIPSSYNRNQHCYTRKKITTYKLYINRNEKKSLKIAVEALIDIA